MSEIFQIQSVDENGVIRQIDLTKEQYAAAIRAATAQAQQSAQPATKEASHSGLSGMSINDLMSMHYQRAEALRQKHECEMQSLLSMHLADCQRMSRGMFPRDPNIFDLVPKRVRNNGAAMATGGGIAGFVAGVIAGTMFKD